MSRYSLMRLHMLLAGFLMPLAILYFVGGALYTADIKGSVAKQAFTLQLEQPFNPDLEYLTQLTRQALVARQLELPSDEPSLKKKKGEYVLQWGGLHYAVMLTVSHSEQVATLTYRKRSLLAQMMRVHRGEAGAAFKVLSLMMAAGLMVILITGYYMAWSIPRFRRPLLISTGSGLLTMAVLLLR